MFRSVTIDGFRGFKHFTLEGLGRINLLVGANNSGKTSILEAIRLLATRGDPKSLWDDCAARGEVFGETFASGTKTASEIEVGHLFYGHKLEDNIHFSISARGLSLDEHIAYSVVPLTTDELARLKSESFTEFEFVVLEILEKDSSHRLEFTERGGVSYREISHERQNWSPPACSVTFLRTDSFSSEYVVNKIQDIAFLPDEIEVLKALQIVEPSLVGLRGRIPTTVHRSGVIVKLQNIATPMPIGSLGEGVWRMLNLAIGIASAKDGYLLVDEIDTGLHYTVLKKMWRMLYERAKALNVQVFATTHSSDCVSSLGWLCQDNEDAHDISLQRIDPQFDTSTNLTEQEYLRAAEHGSEVR
jgi:energy-coupling factor transporter ATP-binding protein EcfA2